MSSAPRKARMLMLTALLGIGLIVTLVITASRRSSVTLEGIDELIRSEIPIGSSKEQVYDFLDSRQIPSKGYDVGPDPLYGLPERLRERKRYVTARIPQRPDPAVSEYDIRIVFYFDETLRLIDYKPQQLDNVP